MGRYYWLKIGDMFLESDEMQWLDEQGMLNSYVYIKLCVKSLRHDGLLVREVGTSVMPLTHEKLAEMVRLSVEQFESVLEKLLEVGLIERTERGYKITKLEGLVGSGSDNAAALRQQRWRDRHKNDVSVTKNNASHNALHNERTDNREQITDIREEKKITKRNAKRNATFSPPSLDEINAYIAEKNLKVDGQFFYTFFSESNWVDSTGNKVKSWKQKLLTWNKMEEGRNGNTPRRGDGANKQKTDGSETDWSKERGDWNNVPL